VAQAVLEQQIKVLLVVLEHLMLKLVQVAVVRQQLVP
jgi:hypothetical protein